MQTDNAGFTKRDDAYVFEYDGKIWLSQGYDVGRIARTDLLNSTDGINFNVINHNLPFAPYVPIVPHNGWIYIVGKNIWRTKDGITITQLTPRTAIPPYSPTANIVSYKEKIHLINETDIWSSQDGLSWTHTPLPWKNPRSSNKAVVFKDRIYIIAGASLRPNTPKENGYDYTSKNSVWSTNDPQNPKAWIRDIQNAPFKQRLWPAVTVYKDFLYMTGGYNNVEGNRKNFSDTWRSSDGKNWQKIDVIASFPARHASSLYSFNGNLFIAAGNTNQGASTQQDVWKLTTIVP